jgi:hypothetical protein
MVFTLHGPDLQIRLAFALQFEARAVCEFIPTLNISIIM